MHSTRKLLSILLCLVFFGGLIPQISAKPLPPAVFDVATQITGTGYDSLAFLSDQDADTYIPSAGNVSLTLTNPIGISSLYLLFDLEYGPYTVTDHHTGKTVTAGQRGYLHEFIDLSEAFDTIPTAITLDFCNGSVSLSEIYTFSGAEVPDFVQKWDAPLENETDLLLFSTHGDDEQLFFAGLLPLYAGEKGCRVQVVYMTDHRNLTNERTHEMLNGLWSVGVTAYPVFGNFADFLIKDMQKTYDEYENEYGTSKEDILRFVTEQLRRFKPCVAIGHDINGEYGHGMHMVYTDALIQSLDLISDPAAFPESAEKYGTWELSKLYLHLYEENPIVMNYDQPMTAFDGMTAFEVTQKLGYPCHKSQQYTWFTPWLNGKKTPITKASQIEKYNPCHFGLYHTTVGPDSKKNDFLENVVTYTDQERLEIERLEQEQLEQKRLEQERLEIERLQQKLREQEELERQRLEQQQIEQERKARQFAQVRRIAGAIIPSVFAVILTLLMILLYKRGKNKISL